MTAQFNFIEKVETSTNPKDIYYYNYEVLERKYYAVMLFIHAYNYILF